MQRRRVEDRDASADGDRVLAGERRSAGAAGRDIHARATRGRGAVDRSDEQPDGKRVAQRHFVCRRRAGICDDDLILHRVARIEASARADDRLVQRERGLDDTDVHVRRWIVYHGCAVRSIVVGERRCVRQHDGVLVSGDVRDTRGHPHEEGFVRCVVVICRRRVAEGERVAVAHIRHGGRGHAAAERIRKHAARSRLHGGAQKIEACRKIVRDGEALSDALGQRHEDVVGDRLADRIRRVRRRELVHRRLREDEIRGGCARRVVVDPAAAGALVGIRAGRTRPGDRRGIRDRGTRSRARDDRGIQRDRGGAARCERTQHKVQVSRRRGVRCDACTAHHDAAAERRVVQHDVRVEQVGDADVVCRRVVARSICDRDRIDDRIARVRARSGEHFCDAEHGLDNRRGHRRRSAAVRIGRARAVLVEEHAEGVWQRRARLVADLVQDDGLELNHHLLDRRGRLGIRESAEFEKHVGSAHVAVAVRRGIVRHRGVRHHEGRRAHACLREPGAAERAGGELPRAGDE